MLDVGAGKRRGFLPPSFGRQIEIFGADKIADAAALVDFGDAGPEAIEFLCELIGFVEENRGLRDEIEDGAVGSGDGSVELPAGENVEATGADGGFDDLFVAGNALAAEARMNCAEKMFADWSFGERKQQGFVDGIRRTLRGGIELANGVGFIAEELDAQGAVGLGRVNVENAAADSILAGHFDHVGGGIADGVEVREKGIEIEGSRLGGWCGRDRHNNRWSAGGWRWPRPGRPQWMRAGGDLPQSGGAFFLEFGMRREILEGKDVAGGEGDDGLRIAGGSEFTEAAEDRKKVFDSAIIVDDEDERASGGALKQHEQQGFCGGSEAGDTNAPRALLEVGGNTREGGKLFYVHEEFADEGKKHAGLF